MKDGAFRDPSYIQILYRYDSAPVKRPWCVIRKVGTGCPKRSCSNKKQDPEKWEPVFQKDHSQTKR
jgi:hypothetical protein